MLDIFLVTVKLELLTIYENTGPNFERPTHAYSNFVIILFFIFIAKDCGSIKIPLNGTKRGNRTTYPNKVSFTCDDGFHLKGSNVRECKSDGVWSGEETFCEGNKTP